MVVSLPIGNDYHNISPGPQHLYGRWTVWTPQCFYLAALGWWISAQQHSGMLFAFPSFHLFCNQRKWIYFSIPGEKFANPVYISRSKIYGGMWEWKMEKYCGLLDSAAARGDNSRGRSGCRTPPRQFNRDIINSYHVLTNIFGIPAAICST